MYLSLAIKVAGWLGNARPTGSPESARNRIGADQVGLCSSKPSTFPAASSLLTAWVARTFVASDAGIGVMVFCDLKQAAEVGAD